MNLVCLVQQKENTTLTKLLSSSVFFRCRQFNYYRSEGLIEFEGLDRSDFDEVIHILDEIFIFNDIFAESSLEEIALSSVVPSISSRNTTQQHRNSSSGPFRIYDVDDLKFIKFGDAIADYHMSRIHKTLYEAIHKSFATPDDIWKFLLSARAEIKINYNPPEIIDFNVGDVVLCNYGTHPDGEISGGHVASVVCDISEDGIAFVVPITTHRCKDDLTRFLPITVGSDVLYDNPDFKGGTLLLQMGKYVRAERFEKVIGKVTPEFFTRLIATISGVYDFSLNNLTDEA